jgi:hypothetical protein
MVRAVKFERGSRIVLCALRSTRKLSTPVIRELVLSEGSLRKGVANPSRTTHSHGFEHKKPKRNSVSERVTVTLRGMGCGIP